MTDTRTATARRSDASPSGTSGASRGRPDRAGAGSWPVRERSLVAAVLGIPPAVAVLLALGATAVGVAADLFRIGTVGAIFEVAYGVGCLAAVAWVRRRSLFLPAIQPPLLLAVVVPVLAVLVGAPSSSAGVTEHLLLAGAPLINAFPAMAVTTVLVLLLAAFRLVRQRTGPDDAVGVALARLPGRRDRPAGSRGSDDDRVPSGDRRRPADRTRSEGRGSDRSSTRPADGPAERRPARRRPAAGSAGARGSAERTARSGEDRGRTGRGRADGSRSSRTEDGREPGRARDGRPVRRSGSAADRARDRRPRRPDTR